MRRWQASSMKCAPFSALSREQDAVVGEDRDRHPPDAREAADQGRAVERLELVELGAVDDPRDHLVHVVGRAHVVGDDAVQLLRVELRRRPARRGRGRPPSPCSAARRCRGRSPAHARHSRRDGRPRRTCGAWRSPPPRSSARDHLAGRRLHQRRAGEEDRALVADDHALVGHRRHIGAAGGAAAHHAGDLGDALRPTSAPGCRRSGRNGRGRGRPRPGAAGWRRRCRPDRRRAAGSAARSPARADASSPSSDNRCRPSPSASLATIIVSRPETRPMPAIIPAPGASPLYMSLAASWPISRKGEPGSSSRSTRSRGSSLPRDDMPLAMLLRSAERRLRDARAQLVRQRPIVRGIGAESVAILVDLGGEQGHCLPRHASAQAPGIQRRNRCSLAR